MRPLILDFAGQQLRPFRLDYRASDTGPLGVVPSTFTPPGGWVTTRRSAGSERGAPVVTQKWSLNPSEEFLEGAVVSHGSESWSSSGNESGKEWNEVATSWKGSGREEWSGSGNEWGFSTGGQDRDFSTGSAPANGKEEGTSKDSSRFGGAAPGRGAEKHSGLIPPPPARKEKSSWEQKNADPVVAVTASPPAYGTTQWRKLGPTMQETTSASDHERCGHHERCGERGADLLLPRGEDASAYYLLPRGDENLLPGGDGEEREPALLVPRPGPSESGGAVLPYKRVMDEYSQLQIAQQVGCFFGGGFGFFVGYWCLWEGSCPPAPTR